jgi:hypothetical protein
MIASARSPSNFDWARATAQSARKQVRRRRWCRGICPGRPRGSRGRRCVARARGALPRSDRSTSRTHTRRPRQRSLGCSPCCALVAASGQPVSVRSGSAPERRGAHPDLRERSRESSGVSRASLEGASAWAVTAASSNSQPGSRAAHVAATAHVRQSWFRIGCGGSLRGYRELHARKV